MLRKLLVLVMAGALGAWILSACDDEGDGDADADTDVDTDVDADGDGDADGWPCAQPSTATPQFRLTTLQVTAPTALRNPLLSAIIESSVDDFRFIWLLEVDTAGSRVTTGSGRAEAVPPTNDDQFCTVTWNTGSYTPVSETITITGNTFSTTGPMDMLEIPIYSEESPDEPLLVLPISQLEILDAEMNADRTLIGTPNAPAGSQSYAGDWVAAGSIRGWISVEDARNVVIEDLGQTLCGLLSGDSGAAGPEDDCSSEQGTWTNQPETIPGTTEPGYLLEAGIGAGAVTIE